MTMNTHHFSWPVILGIHLHPNFACCFIIAFLVFTFPFPAVVVEDDGRIRVDFMPSGGRGDFVQTTKYLESDIAIYVTSLHPTVNSSACSPNLPTS